MLLDKNKPTLFIYIPTYDRYKFLEKQIDNLVQQLPSFKSRVRILVSNNNSQDGNYKALLSKYVDEPIEFRDNPGNIGANANITLGFVFAKKDEFLWILSDDEMITPFALQEIFSKINSSIDVVHIGEYETIEYKKLQLNNMLTLPKGAGFGLISVGIFNMKFISQYLINGFDYLDSSFPHLAILMAALNGNKCATMACIRHDLVFTSEILMTHGTGDYTVSSVGFGYLGDFFQERERNKLLWSWLKDNWRGFLDIKHKNQIKYNKALGYLAITNPAMFVFLIVARLPRWLLTFKRSIFKTKSNEVNK